MSETKTETFECPRQNESFLDRNFKAKWREDHTCSYCGSLSEEMFFKAIDAGAKLGATDKAYKVYVGSTEAVPLYQSYINCPDKSDCTGPDDCTHWVTRPTSQGKFYFQHLSEEGRDKFVQLHNDKKLNIGYPGHFYVTPFFCQRKDPGES